MTTARTTRASEAAVAIATLQDRLMELAPNGWTLTSGMGWIDMNGDVWKHGERGSGVAPETQFVRCERTDGDLHVTIALNLVDPGTDSWNVRRAYDGVTVEGHTMYNGRTFTRRGIDVSSCVLINVPEYPNEYNNLDALLAGEFARCVAAYAKSRRAVPVPSLPFSVQPEWFAESKAVLESNRTVYLRPHGMGTGYAITTGDRSRGRMVGRRRADASLEAAIGLSPLYVESLDCD